MVHFTRSGSRALFYSGVRVTGSLPPGYPIRLSADQWVCAPPRGFSQLITAFLVLRLLKASAMNLYIAWPYYLFRPGAPSLPRPGDPRTKPVSRTTRRSRRGRTNPELRQNRPLFPFTFPAFKELSKTLILFIGLQSLVEIRGLEPLTLGLQSRCSSQLS